MRRVPAFADVTSFALLASLLAVQAAIGRSSEPVPFRILAGPYSRHTAKTGEGKPIVRERLGGLTVSVEFLEPEARAAFVKSIAGGLPDPFASPPGHPPRYNVFRVAFENGSGVDVQFQPGNVILITDRKDQAFPIDLTDLYRIAVQASLPDPEGAIDRIAPLVYDSSMTIPNGARVERLLVFGPFPEKWKDMQVYFSYLQIGTATRTAAFPFHKQLLKE